MFDKLWFKLTAAFLLVAIVVVTVVAVLVNKATSAGFNRFLSQDAAAEIANLQEDLARYYAGQDSWAGVEPFLSTSRPGQGMGSGGGGTVLLLQDASGNVVASSGGGRGRRATGESGEQYPIMAGGVIVGTLIVDQPGGTGGGAGQQFLDDVNQAIILAGLAAVGLALLLGLFLARSLTRPLGRLTKATRALSRGDLDQRVTVDSRDEVGELSGSFNQMAAALAENERQRQQLFADIAHELRTPVSVIRGQLEGMLDGVFELTPENVSIVHEETLLLNQLIEELRTLSLAESGQLPLDRNPLDMGELVAQAAAAFDPLAEAEGVGLSLEIELDLPLVSADAARMHQVLGNLLSNALRHAGLGNGRKPEVHLRVVALSDGLRVSVVDNGPGLSAEAREHVFDRFWRADAARSRDQGGSGLGLAISRGIVVAHGGRIWVESSPGQGASFNFELSTT